MTMKITDYTKNGWEKFWSVDESQCVLKHHSGVEFNFSRMRFGVGFTSFLSLQNPNQELLNLSDLGALQQQARKYLATYPEFESEFSAGIANPFTIQDVANPVIFLNMMARDIIELNTTLVMQQKGLAELAQNGLRQSPQSIQFGQAALDQFYTPKFDFYQQQKKLWLQQSEANQALRQILEDFQKLLDALDTNIQIMSASFQKGDAVYKGQSVH